MTHIVVPTAGYIEFCQGMPKAELHMHIEGSLTPQQRIKLARRNQLPTAGLTLNDIEEARNFGTSGTAVGDLRQMLDYYYGGIEVLRVRQDFFEMTYAYLRKCSEENVQYAEISFDPQAHTSRGISFEDVVSGLVDAIEAARRTRAVAASLIMCINRDKTIESAFEMLRAAEPYRQYILGMGLDSNEQGNPPIKFKDVYKEAAQQGYRLTAHCDVDQEDSVRHIWQCIDVLGVDRIDHGLNCIEDRALVDELKARQTCLTGCPTWRPRDAGPRRMDRIRAMFDHGLRVTLNSDDPGVFTSGTLGHMFPYAAAVGNFTQAEAAQLSINAFEGSWLAEQDKADMVGKVAAYAQGSRAPSAQCEEAQ
jgi:adenosine deaminase